MATRGAWIDVNDRLPPPGTVAWVTTSVDNESLLAQRVKETDIGRGGPGWQIRGKPAPWPDSDDDAAGVTHWAVWPLWVPRGTRGI